MDDQWVKKNAEHTGQCGDGLFGWQAGGDLYIEGHGEICMDAFSWNSSIRNVKIAPGCTGIGICAFHGCNLESVELPDGLERIDAYAFSVAAPLSLTIPDSVTEIDWYAFENVNEIIYRGPLKPDPDSHDSSDENWGAVNWIGRPIIVAFSRWPLASDALELFDGTGIAVYDKGVVWGKQEPIAGIEMVIDVCYPFYCTVGEVFWARYTTESAFEKEILSRFGVIKELKDRFVQVKLLSVLESDQASAKVRVMILQVKDMLSFVNPVKEAVKKELQERHSYNYIEPDGDLPFPYIRNINSNLFSVFNTLGGGDVSFYDYICTDEDGIDHLICVRDSEEKAVVGDRILGYHSDSPYQWENGLFIDKKTKTVMRCCDDAKTVMIPDGIVNMYNFSNCRNLEKITIPESVKRIYGTLASNIKEVILIGNFDLLRGELPKNAVIVRIPQ